MKGKRNLRKDQYAEYNLRVLNVVAHYAAHQEDPREGWRFLSEQVSRKANLVGYIFSATICWRIFVYQELGHVGELEVHYRVLRAEQLLAIFGEMYLKAKKEMKADDKTKQTRQGIKRRDKKS